MAVTNTASLNDFLMDNWAAAYEQSLQPYNDRMAYVTQYMQDNNINPDSYGPALLDQWKQELGVLPETGFNPNGTWNLDMSQEDFFNKYFGPQSSWSGSGNVSYDPTSGQVNYKSFDDEYDFGNTLIGLGAAGIGSLSGGFGISELLGGLGGETITGSAETLTQPETFLGSADAGGSMDWTDLLTEESGLADQVMTGDEGLMSLFGDGTQAFEGLAADSSLQNAALMEAAGLIPSGSLLSTLGDAGKVASLLSTAKSLLSDPSASGNTALDAIKKILSGSGSGDDWLKLIGTAAPGLIAAYASGQQADALKEIANQQQARYDQFVGFGAPYRQKLSDLYSNPGSFLQSPEVQSSVQQGTDALARSLSAKVGNPIGNMTALGELQNYSANQLFGRLGQEKDRLAGFGGLSAYNQAGAGGSNLQSLLAASGADAGVWGGIGRAAGDVFNPAPNTLSDIWKQLQGNNIFGVK